MKKIIQDYSLSELEELVSELGEAKFRALQIYQNLYLGKSIKTINNIPNSLKEKLLDLFEDETITIFDKLISKDGTQKFLYKLSDGNIIEGVLLKYKYGYTICVSTQVGCRMGCKFCASTLGGLIRNLTSGEILSQVLIVNSLLGGFLGDKRKITNIVLMGSGEPLDNYDNVTKFLNLVSAPKGLNISERNISLSTCGLCENIAKLADDGHTVTLTISLHAPTDEIRRQTMPIANKYTIDEIIAASRYYFEKTHRRIIFEYALVKDVNDGFEHATILKERFKNLSCHFNIIPLNDVKERNLISSGRKRAYTFVEKLTQLGLSATVRRTMGEDVGGACGQLRNSVIKKEAL